MDETEAPDALEDVVEPLRSALVRRGFSALTEVQRAVLRDGLGLANLRISSQTGSGKTVAIGLAVAEELLEPGPNDALVARDAQAGPRVLVIAPTRELAVQVRDELAWLYAGVKGFEIGVVTGGKDIIRERRLLQRQPEALVGTPGRLLDHIRTGALACGNVCAVILDEADRMLDMGFREELEAIVAALPTERRSHLVSATFPREVLELARAFQSEAIDLQGTRLGAANADIDHSVYLIRRPDTYAALVNLLLLAQGARCLVFVRRRVDATDLAEKLVGDGFSALPFSGDLPQAQRTRTLESFRNGIVNTLISTDVAARGIDVPDIATVIHADPPLDPDSYTHRSGRTGRAGRKGHSAMLVATHDRRRVQRLLQATGVKAEWKPVPSPEKVKKAITKRARTRLHDALAEPIEAVAEREYAAKLLVDHDPTALVATLLRCAEPPLPREPMVVAPVEVREDAPYATRSASAPRGTPRSQDFTRFFVTWGRRDGATTERILAHVLRRSALSREAIGAILIEPRSAVVEVANRVARDFEARTRVPDDRDPHVRIRPFQAPAPDAVHARPPRPKWDRSQRRSGGRGQRLVGKKTPEA